MYVCILTYTYMCTHTHMHIYMHMCMYPCLCVYISIYLSISVSVSPGGILPPLAAGLAFRNLCIQQEQLERVFREKSQRKSKGGRLRHFSNRIQRQQQHTHRQCAELNVRCNADEREREGEGKSVFLILCLRTLNFLCWFLHFPVVPLAPSDCAQEPPFMLSTMFWSMKGTAEPSFYLKHSGRSLLYRSRRLPSSQVKEAAIKMEKCQIAKLEIV